jgi:hypothetical protein
MLVVWVKPPLAGVPLPYVPVTVTVLFPGGVLLMVLIVILL